MNKKINGNVSGIKNSLLERIEDLYSLEQSNSVFLSEELCRELSQLTELIGREISLLIARNGQIADVSIGDASTVAMPEIRLARNLDRLCGVRCIHTHPNGNARLSEVDLGSLNAMRLDAMVSIGVADGKPTAVYAAFVNRNESGENQALVFGPMRSDRLPQKRLLNEIIEADARLKAFTGLTDESRPQRAVLVGIEGGEGYDTLAELEELAKTAGVQTVYKELQRKRGIDNATYIGSGKAEELRLVCRAEEADVVIFDDELSAIQMRNLEELFQLPVIDRTMLILDIFASRATTGEGKLQVELAQLKYRLPRLLGMGIALSRQGASCVGMRGPGEKKLEIDRRRIRRRIYELEQELKEVESRRSLHRNAKNRRSYPLIALVGYTNAGKSTLLNRLTGSDAIAEDKLFATLDPLIRKLTLPNGLECLVSDTVGFINKLPHELVKAFRSTLEEVADADLILHIIDSSSEYYNVQMRVVEEVLSSLGAGDTPKLKVFNKIDRNADYPKNGSASVGISALSGEGTELLLEKIEDKLNEGTRRFELLIPYENYSEIDAVRSAGTVLNESHCDEGTKLTMLIDNERVWQINKYIV
ncbi:MAG: GTPase HflX [Clostridia bacterium]|nr:GTPase HflX [Clostridia bacterium]